MKTSIYLHIVVLDSDTGNPRCRYIKGMKIKFDTTCDRTNLNLNMIHKMQQ